MPITMGGYQKNVSLSTVRHAYLTTYITQWIICLHLNFSIYSETKKKLTTISLRVVNSNKCVQLIKCANKGGPTASVR